jgi:hypothetical protein
MGEGTKARDARLAERFGDDLGTRIEHAVTEADADFWCRIAGFFPEIETGDAAPDAVFGLHAILEEHVREWLDNNP